MSEPVHMPEDEDRVEVSPSLSSIYSLQGHLECRQNNSMQRTALRANVEMIDLHQPTAVEQGLMGVLWIQNAAGGWFLELASRWKRTWQHSNGLVGVMTFATNSSVQLISVHFKKVEPFKLKTNTS
eukprot:scaffold45267_cov234-Skeletonema_marinoi.AAC.1